MRVMREKFLINSDAYPLELVFQKLLKGETLYCQENSTKIEVDAIGILYTS
jgi:hypothetical protein